MTAQDLAQVVAFITDKNSIDDPQDVYRLLRRAVADRDQPAFWRYVFVLIRTIHRQYHYLAQ